MKAQSTLERELRRVQQAKTQAYVEGNQETEDWLYGAETALSWALGKDTQSPARAFGGVAR